eukprot:CAMPEP_0184318208 /NCGR_PEP_ID=MMETSP1049-20130417/101225_1 /TAXON_ID=77928 /ORGANISM="Proteomonas sulcata, Strain CCMP704" /LENGTH=276 /DNA_ID=CAMNT_0026637897 /DNA_START=265 /DNA_END=1098 /DNA_ORIENTATION=+
MDPMLKSCSKIVMLHRRHQESQTGLNLSKETAISLVREYREKVLTRLLGKCYELRNGSYQTQSTSILGNEEDSDDAQVMFRKEVVSTLHGKVLGHYDDFLSMPPQNEGDLKDWFKDHHSHLAGEVCDVARVVHSVPPGQGDCAGVFSISGILQQLRRSNLSVESMDDRVFIHDNFPSDPTEILVRTPGTATKDKTFLSGLKEDCFSGMKESMIDIDTMCQKIKSLDWSTTEGLREYMLLEESLNSALDDMVQNPENNIRPEDVEGHVGIQVPHENE